MGVARRSEALIIQRAGDVRELTQTLLVPPASSIDVLDDATSMQVPQAPRAVAVVLADRAWRWTASSDYTGPHADGQNSSSGSDRRASGLTFIRWLLSAIAITSPPGCRPAG